MPHPDPPNPNPEIGASIKRARRGAALTLADLSARCGLSESFLSKLERGVTAASIANLLQICTALEIEIALLFERVGNETKRTDVSVHRRDDAGFSFVNATGYAWKRLGGGKTLDRMEVFHLILPEHDKMEAFVAHPGQEHCFVISGEVIFDVGEQSINLKAGDGIYINSEQPHRARNAGPGEAQILMTVAGDDSPPSTFDWWCPKGAISEHAISNQQAGV